MPEQLMLDVSKEYRIAGECIRVTQRFSSRRACWEWIQQRSKTVWIATGTYRGHEYEVRGRTPSVALALWMEAVQYRGTSI